MTQYLDYKSWPFQEARKLHAHITKKGKKPGDTVTFETGYGPSGLPHIGTFGEVVRTLWVMRAFDLLTDNAYKSRLIMFSDDYDALRKVPDDIKEALGDDLESWSKQYLGCTLSSIPNPYDVYSSDTFSGTNNDKLCEFVDNLLMSYDGSTVGASPARSRVSFVSSMEYYKGGRFNSLLERVWDNYQAILDVMLPTLGDERRETYSPIMPIGPGHTVFQVAVIPTEKKDGECWITYMRPTDQIPIHANIEHGAVKLQWKVDWAMRWVFFDVDYEMSGKDLTDSVKASSQICRILGGTPPVNLTYELFLDENGEKISKSKGNGFSVEDWLKYGSIEGLMLFMFQNPKSAKKIYRDLVPSIEDQYLKMLTKKALTPDDAPWHFSTFEIPLIESELSYNLLLNLAIVSQSTTLERLMGYLTQNRSLSPYEQFLAERLGESVLRYANDTDKLNRPLRAPTETEKAAFMDLSTRLSNMMPDMDAEHFQYQVYEVGKNFGFEPLRSWFQALYECLLGNSDGPRFGVFIKTYGLDNTINLLNRISKD